MTDIVLTTMNARYWHSAFGLRYLMANMGELEARTELLEFGIGDRPVDIISTLLARRPVIVAIGVYIWNVEVATRLVSDLKQVAPEIVVVIGGPEVSYETEAQPIAALADYVVCGEGDLSVPALCRKILLEGNRPIEKVIPSSVPNLADVKLPYHLYTDEDIAHRVIYVEVSRGCPFTCEFCLSALDIPVRLFDVDEFLNAMQSLLDRGARQFKFVDRTFNLNIRISKQILQFFLDRFCEGVFLHFEMIPDRLPDDLRSLIAKFPPGALQFEIGVQTFNDEVGNRISRKQDNEKLEDNFRYLTTETGVHIHADLIIGLPGESVESFGQGFDRLVALKPQEIQVGILKRLKGTPITQHDEEWQMVFSAYPPFEILSNRLISFDTMHRLRRFSRYWDLVANSGNFRSTLEYLFKETKSPFQTFLVFSDWLFQTENKTHGISLAVLHERIFEFSTLLLQQIPEIMAAKLWRDYVRGGRRDKPKFLQPFDLPPAHELISQPTVALPARQAAHQD